MTADGAARAAAPLTGETGGPLSVEKYLLPRNLALLFAGGLVVLSVLYMAGALRGLVAILPSIPLCPFRLLTHMDCPGCGMTRAILALAAGDLWRAACLNPFCYFIVFLTGLSLVPRNVLAREPEGTAWLLKALYVGLLVVALAYWLVFKVLRFLPLPG
jgi:hypothetical protein